jgi:hypothetical protein
MPKSNFNQFLDECEDFVTEKKSTRKISFETKPTCENQTNQTNQNCHHDIKTLNTFSSNSNLNTRCSSSNIFLLKSAKNTRDNFDRFSTNGMNNYTTAYSTTNVQTNIFKKTGDNNCFKPIPTVTSSSSMPIVEINNETFPSLTSTTVAAATTGNVPKKFKNFKDAVCASAPVPAPSISPIKQKQTQVVLPNYTMGVSEMYSKKMLAKTKNLVAFYDDDDDGDDGDDDDYYEFSCNRNSKPMFIKNYGNDSD